MLKVRPSLNLLSPDDLLPNAPLLRIPCTAPAAVWTGNLAQVSVLCISRVCSEELSVSSPDFWVALSPSAHRYGPACSISLGDCYFALDDKHICSVFWLLVFSVILIKHSE